MATLLVYLAMPLLGCFGKQNDALVGWPDAISADPLMDFETYQASFSVELIEPLDGYSLPVEDTVAVLARGLREAPSD